MNVPNIDFAIRIFKIFASIDCRDDLWWNIDNDNNFTFSTNCNDVFWWGCADAEDITPENINQLELAINDLKDLDKRKGKDNLDEIFYAPSLFCARVRKMRPQGAFYGHLSDELAELFDACGPEREVSFSNTPKPPKKESLKTENKSSVIKEKKGLWSKIKEIF